MFLRPISRMLPIFLACLLLAGGPLCSAQPKDIARIIFDSDMSSDWDDVGDIAVLHGMASLGECEILGMMNSSLNGATPLCMNAINTYYGKPGIPIGVRPDTGGIGMYAAQIAAEFPHDLKSWKDCPLAADLYRKILAAQPDHSVTIVTTGYLTNLKALLQSGPDQYSPLNGTDLIRQKVKLWSCAGGAFPSGNEFNFRASGDDSAYIVVNNWPTRVTYVGFEIGQVIRTAGGLPETSKLNPVRRVYVDIKENYPYPSWGQIAIYYAVRPSEDLWNVMNVGRNHCDEPGTNWWSTDSDPAGDQDQAYLLEKVRFPVNAALDALLTLPPNDGSPSKPGRPTNVRATIVGDDRVDLQWTDNAFNETGFRIERQINGVFTPVASVGADVTRCSLTGITSIPRSVFRVRAYNAAGDSDFSYVWIYSGWTEINLAGSGTTPPLYDYYQCSNLRWARGGDFRPDHVALNNDSEHGKDVTIDVDVSATGSEGKFYVYLFYQNPDNWYRLSAEHAGCKFEKRINGATTQVGPTGPPVAIGNGSGLEHWRIVATSSGSLKFIREMPYASQPEKARQQTGTLLDVRETFSLARGKIGLGGWARTPVWQNFHFEAPADETAAPTP